MTNEHKWVVGKEGTMIATVHGGGSENAADARAIAAVPEMIEALKIARELLDATLGTAEWAPGGKEWAEKRAAMIDAALEKAGAL